MVKTDLFDSPHDFQTPRKVAVQLSKDLYRYVIAPFRFLQRYVCTFNSLKCFLSNLHSNLVPQLKPRGVDIQAVVEYREGQYFVLAGESRRPRLGYLPQIVTARFVALFRLRCVRACYK